MEMNIVLYNPLSNSGKSGKTLKKYLKKIKNVEHMVYDVTKTKVNEILYKEKDVFIIIGGDGTLHQLVNIFRELNITNRVFLYKGGTGNDFSRDFKMKLIELTTHISHSPKTNGKHFLTSSGFGVDGEVCLNVNENQQSSYFKVALKTFKTFKTFNMKLVVDGVEHNFKNVWFATTMNGRCIGGGMILSPKSIRLDDKLEVYVIHSIGLFKLITIFPSIFLGKHRIFKKCIFNTVGHDIQMIADKEQVMQSDGEIYGKVKEISSKF